MKGFLLLIFILFYTAIVAQVPVPREEMRLDVVPDIGNRNENAGHYQQNGKYGFVYPQNTRQEAIYDKIISGSNGFIVKKGNLYGITDKKGVLIGKMEYDAIEVLKGNYLVKKNGKFGTLSNDGNPLLSIKYHKILGGNDLVTLVQNSKSDIRLVFNNSENIFPQKIEYADLHNNLAIVKTNGKFGVITDKIIVPFEYDSIAHNISKKSNTVKRTIENNIDIHNVTRAPIFDFVVLKNDKLGLINSEGSIIYPAENDEIYREGIKAYYLIKKENLYSIYFSSSKKKTAFDYSRVYADGYGYVMAIKDKKAGVFNVQGEEIIPFEYDDDFIMQYSGIGLRVTKNKKRGIINPAGNIIVPVIYDDVSTLYESGFRDFIKVTLEGKTGIVALSGNMIVPIAFEWVGVENGFFKVVTPEPDKKFGLYDKTGKVIIPAEYQWITNSDTENSKITILKKADNSYNFLNEKNELILSENCSEFGYVPNEYQLLNPFHYLLYVKNTKGKIGMLNEITGTLAIPMVYDAIMQRFEDGKHTYYSVQKGNKFGLINEKNEEIIPIKYNDINIDFVTVTDGKSPLIVVAKGKKYGAVNLKNEVPIPFQYNELQRISELELYKGKKGKLYQIINGNNNMISNDLFDEVANFEQKEGFEYGDKPSYQALTFRDGKMRVINDTGNYITSETAMQPHKGYKSFDELKFALVEALDSPDDVLLKNFVDKIAPSDHVLYYLKRNMFNNNSLGYSNIPYIKEKYYDNLQQFKHRYWSGSSGIGYNRSSLTKITDYTLYRDGYVTNARNKDHAFGSVKYLEKFLRNAVKINGFWISSYFMKHSF